MLEKIKCPERDSNPRHPDLMEGALTTELPRQPQRSESNISYKRTMFEICRVTYNVYGLSGPAQQDFEWGGSSVSQIFFFGGGGGIRVLVTLRYRKVDLK